MHESHYLNLDQSEQSWIILSDTPKWVDKACRKGKNYKKTYTTRIIQPHIKSNTSEVESYLHRKSSGKKF